MYAIIVNVREEVTTFMNKIPSNVNKAINEFVVGVKKILGNRVRKIILYGSYARR